MGANTTASGISSTAMGENTTASGIYSTAMGTATTAGAFASVAMGFYANAAHSGSFVFGDYSDFSYITTSASNQFVVRAQHIWLGIDNAVSKPANHFLTTSTGAHLTTGGQWVNASDVALKHRFEDVDGEGVLRGVAVLPIRQWSYRAEDASVRHLGPTAQDFRAAFGLGGSDTSIGTVDADGVALLAIQALEGRTRELQVENEELRARLEALEAAITAGRNR